MGAVALRKESVDRNLVPSLLAFQAGAVALRKESVDRNPVLAWKLTVYPVALRKESVDRNNRRLRAVHNAEMSLSARRAWIEIQHM